MAESAESRRRLLEKLTRELGDTIMAALNDNDVVEISLNADGALWETRHGVGRQIIGAMQPIQASNLICTIASMLGLEATRDKPRVRGELPLDGSRFQGHLPPVVEAPTFSIRKRATKLYALADYVAAGILSAHHRDVLERAIEGKANILVAGGTGSGKTTFCNALLHHIAETEPDGRIIIIEDTRELQCSARNRVEFRTSETVTMNDLLYDTLRCDPDRIVVGEVRGKEGHDLLKAWNTGHPGGVATIHANNALASLGRLENLMLEAGVPANPRVIAEAVNIVVSIQKVKGVRSITEIVSVKSWDQERGYQVESL
ncbi:P-type conjugative transfer ATPase TrbB [Methylocaldum sp. BRCS4]|jgi:P-type conjugative transfer ATPase TrbB|uniref:P-type conjugative transfer ATPase TrbB n=1 Tax=Methylocaldum sp. GT1BW TaxID=3438964 RepID=UPI0012EBB1E8|nr:P-type conjugative transfer ATPase TrbB [Methylocaldum sp. BRCS4]